MTSFCSVDWKTVELKESGVEPSRIRKTAGMVILDDSYILVPREEFTLFDYIKIKFRGVEEIASVYMCKGDEVTCNLTSSVFSVIITNIPEDACFFRQMQPHEEQLVKRMAVLEKKIDDNHAVVMSAIDSVEALLNILIGKSP